LQQSGKRIVGGGVGVFRLASGGFGAGEGFLRCDEEVDIVQFVALGSVHRYLLVVSGSVFS
jgi:hypothetical protein